MNTNCPNSDSKEWTLPDPPEGTEPLPKNEKVKPGHWWLGVNKTDWTQWIQILSVGQDDDQRDGYLYRRPLPSQAPEEPSLDPKSPEATSRFIAKQADQIHALTRERDEARAKHRQHKDELVELHETRRVLTSRAETAEARVKVLEGELAEVKTAYTTAAQERDLSRWELAKAAPTWIPVSTPPTRVDAVQNGYNPYVLWCNGRGLWNSRHDDDHRSCQFPPTHWMKLPPLPPSTQSDEEPLRKDFERDAAPFVCNFTRWTDGIYADSLTQDLWTGYKRGKMEASRKGAQP